MPQLITINEFLIATDITAKDLSKFELKQRAGIGRYDRWDDKNIPRRTKAIRKIAKYLPATRGLRLKENCPAADLPLYGFVYVYYGEGEDDIFTINLSDKRRPEKYVLYDRNSDLNDSNKADCKTNSLPKLIKYINTKYNK